MKMSVELVMIMLVMTVFRIVQVTGVAMLHLEIITLMQMVMALVLEMQLNFVVHM